MTIVTLGVKNLATSNHFYEHIFGWKKLPSSNEGVSFFQLNGVLLSLYPNNKLAEDAEVDSKGRGFRSFSLAYTTRSKKEVDQLMTDLEAQGVPVVKRPEEVFWGGYSGYIADPDGTLWEIAYNPFLALDAQGNAIEPK